MSLRQRKERALRADPRTWSRQEIARRLAAAPTWAQGVRAVRAAFYASLANVSITFDDPEKEKK